MLKNYTVIVKNVNINKEANLLNYLVNNKHKNHIKKDTKIIELSNRDTYEAHNLKKLKLNHNNYVLNGKGGKPLKRISKSFTFNLPKSYKSITSVKQMQQIDSILKRQITKIYADFNIDINVEEIYSVLHYQDNPHLHLLTPYLDKNGKVIRQINHKGFTSKLKITFSKIVDKVLNQDMSKYKKNSTQENNNTKIKIDLERLKDWYLILIKIDGIQTKYYKNQIVAIERMLKDIDNVVEDDINRIYKNVDKVKKGRKAAKMQTPTI